MENKTSTLWEKSDSERRDLAVRIHSVRASCTLAAAAESLRKPENEAALESLLALLQTKGAADKPALSLPDIRPSEEAIERLEVAMDHLAEARAQAADEKGSES